MRNWNIAVSMLMLLTFVAVSGSAITASRSRSTAGNGDLYGQLDLFGDVLAHIRTDYVEKPDDNLLIEHAINGMLNSLDPHSGYITRYNVLVATSGMGGLGIDVTMEDGVLKVISPIESSST